MPTLYFCSQHETLVKELTTDTIVGNSQMFPYYRDLMLFAAMVGKRNKRQRERVGTGGEVESVAISGEGFNKDGVVYLLGLLEFDSPNILKDGAKKCWKLFECYCCGGMDIIAEWLSSAESTDYYADIIQEKLAEEALKSKKKPKIITIRKKLTV